jgi:hypothetical protein
MLGLKPQPPKENSRGLRWHSALVEAEFVLAPGGAAPPLQLKNQRSPPEVELRGRSCARRGDRTDMGRSSAAPLQDRGGGATGNGVVGSACDWGARDANWVDYFGGISGLGRLRGGGEDVCESGASDWDGYACVCGGVVFGGRGEYVFRRDARGVCVSGGVTDFSCDFFSAGDCGCGGSEVVAVKRADRGVRHLLSSAAEAALVRSRLCRG